jgi:hypothetical protein
MSTRMLALSRLVLKSEHSDTLRSADNLALMLDKLCKYTNNSQAFETNSSQITQRGGELRVVLAR